MIINGSHSQQCGYRFFIYTIVIFGLIYKQLSRELLPKRLVCL